MRLPTSMKRFHETRARYTCAGRTGTKALMPDPSERGRTVARGPAKDSRRKRPAHKPLDVGKLLAILDNCLCENAIWETNLFLNFCRIS